MTVSIDMQHVKCLHISQERHGPWSVFAENRQSTTGFCLYLGGRFDVKKAGEDSWEEIPGTLRPIKKGRPPLSESERRDAFVGANVASDLKEWAANQPEGISTLINQLLSDERRRRNPV
jgi:hypothetical protein